MTAFDQAMIWIRQAEGGYGVPDEPTYCGINRKDNPTWSGWPILDRAGWPIPKDILAELNSLASCFYLSMYWIPHSLGNFPGGTAIVLLDTMVNQGNKGVGMIQTCLNMHYGLSLAVDSVWGPATYGAIFGIVTQACPAEAAFIQIILNARAANYLALAQEERFAKFEHGWLNRLTNLRAYLATLGGSPCAV